MAVTSHPPPRQRPRHVSGVLGRRRDVWVEGLVEQEDGHGRVTSSSAGTPDTPGLPRVTQFPHRRFQIRPDVPNSSVEHLFQIAQFPNHWLHYW